MPPRTPAQVRILTAWGVYWRQRLNTRIGTPTATKRAKRTTGIMSSEAASRSMRKERARTSRPMSTKSTALRISSMSSQNVSTCRSVVSDIANSLPWFPMKSPATTMARGPETCSLVARALPPRTRARVRRIST
jgi:hypothetical protein